jgi:nitrite reductase (NADH) small subunit
MNAMSPSWLNLCSESDLVTGSGVCALLETGGSVQQVALFRPSATGPVYALSNYDPIGDACVLSRGILGSIGERLVVASPLYKQHFCLDDGQCIEDPSLCLPTWPVRIQAGVVQICIDATASNVEVGD